MSPGPTTPAAGDELAAEVLRQLRSTYGPAVIENETGSAGLYSIPGQVGLFARRCKDPVLVAGTASVGAKLEIARRVGKHDTIGVDLVASCVNEVLVQGALPLFFLDHLETGEVEEGLAVQIVKGLAEGCRQADCALLGGARAARADLHGPGEYSLAGFTVGMVERARLVDGCRAIRSGDLIVALESSGLHATGLGRARQVLLEGARLRLEQAVPELGCPLGEELLRPSRVYARAVRAALERYRVKGVVHGIAHVAEGGLTGRLTRALGRRRVAKIDRAALPRLPVFDLLQRLGGLSDDEMFGTFNMGVGMALVVAPFYADAVARRAKRAGERARVIGEIAAGDGPAVQVA